VYHAEICSAFCVEETPLSRLMPYGVRVRPTASSLLTWPEPGTPLRSLCLAADPSFLPTWLQTLGC
jgi:hypothetical protein